MTTTEERLLAIELGNQFLNDVACNYKRMPQHIRDRALRILRHYPTKADLNMYFRKEIK